MNGKPRPLTPGCSLGIQGYFDSGERRYWQLFS